MTQPDLSGYRPVAGLLIPLPMVPRIIRAIQARYPEATKGIADPEAAVRAALRAWVVETLAEFEGQMAVAPRDMAVVQTIADYEQRGKTARTKAVADAVNIIEDPDLAAMLAQRDQSQTS